MSLQRCQAEHTSTEFLGWQQYMAQELTEPKPEYYYLAQIAAEIRRGHIKNSNKGKLDHFLLRFANAGQQRQAIDNPEWLVAASKAKWAAILGGRARRPPPRKG